MGRSYNKIARMKLFIVGLLLLQTVTAAPGRIRNRTLPVDQIGTITYGISAPGDAGKGEPRPLVVALHPGGNRVAFYGSRFMQQVVIPGLSDLGAVIVAPDCPAASWTDPAAEKAVLALIEKVREEHAIDERRILITGFSMGGRGTWFMASNHPELFTGAIAMAAPAGDAPVDRLAVIPTYVIHSRDDQVVPFAPAQQAASRLEALGRPIRFDGVSGLGHGEVGAYADALRRGGQWIVERWRSSSK